MRRLVGRLKRTRPGVDAPLPLIEPAGLVPPPRELNVFDSLPGRLVILSGSLWLTLMVAREFVALPAIAEIFRKVVALALLAGGAWLLTLTLARNRRRLLWRVRRKLILSYALIGFVPVVLVVAFALTGGVVAYNFVAAYMFHEGMNNLSDDVRQFVETSAAEIGRTPGAEQAALERKYANLSAQYPRLSLAVVPVTAGSNGALTTRDGAVAISGPWAHARPPVTAPGWLTQDGFSGVLAATSSGFDAGRLVIRSAVLTPDGRHVVIGDVPLDDAQLTRLHQRTGTSIGGITITLEGSPAQTTATTMQGGLLSLFRQTIAVMPCTDWDSGRQGRVWLSLLAPLDQLYERLAAAQLTGFATTKPGAWNNFLGAVIGFGLLFLVIQGAALVVGAVLARSITSAVHELFAGTERIQQGDFTQRIAISSRDQLGELADSFNRMSGSIVHLLHVQREKQRLDDELRIARDIQKSLLPTSLPVVPGLQIAELCEPAREVGGDYYDFFEIAPGVLGVLIADVSGKGTSAALYMAELKGLMLALTHTGRSPRDLLVAANRRLSAHLDNRSFITMTYAVIDLHARTVTFARAGHTPFLLVSGGHASVLAPEGMVVGLRLPGASERFEQMLVEWQRPLAPGDLIVLYTDGMTEAMDTAGDLFGDVRLAQLVEAHHTMDPAGVRERVIREVRAFVGDADPHDDMTMVIIKIGDPGDTV